MEAQLYGGCSGQSYTFTFDCSSCLKLSVSTTTLPVTWGHTAESVSWGPFVFCLSPQPSIPLKALSSPSFTSGPCTQTQGLALRMWKVPDRF